MKKKVKKRKLSKSEIEARKKANARRFIQNANNKTPLFGLLEWGEELD